MHSTHLAPFHSTCLLLITAVCIAAALYFAKPIVVPFVVAVSISYALIPMIDALHTRARVPRSLAHLVGILAALGVLALLGALICSSFSGLTSNVGTYQHKLTDLVIKGLRTFEPIAGDIHAEDIRQALGSLPLAKIARRTVDNFATAISNAFLVLVFLVYLLMGRRCSAPAPGVWEEMHRKITRYISLKVVISAITGLLVGLTLWLLGLNLAIAFGVCAFLLNLIPTLGSIVATILPLPIALMQFEAWSATVLVIALPGSIQIVIGNFIEPRLMGKNLDLHPITVLLSLIFWALVWGFMGLFVAVPITAVIKIALEQVDETRPLAHLLSGDLQACRSPEPTRP